MSRPYGAVSLKPDWQSARESRADLVYRSAAVVALQQMRQQFVTEITKEFDDASRLNMLVRASTDPASTGTSAWAGVLAGTAVASAVGGLAPQSAAAGLIARGLSVSLDGVASVTVPERLIDPDDSGGWVGEGQPIPVRSLDVSAGPTLTPYKLAVIIVYTNELAQRSVQDFETITRQMLSESASMMLDKVVFSSDAAVPDLSPAGLLAGVSPISGTVGGGYNAIATDFGLLMDALATAGAGVDVVFVAAPAQAAALRAWAGPKFNYTILASAALAAQTIIAVEASSFVSGFSAAPQFDTSKTTVLHMEDTAPGAISSTSTPGDINAPVRSLWQTDCTSLRMRLRCSFGMRASGHVQYIADASW
jgi:hypothetical protein